MKKQHFKTGLNLKKQLISDLSKDYIRGAGVRSTIAAPTCRESRFSVCPTEFTQTRCNVCNSFAC